MFCICVSHVHVVSVVCGVVCVSYVSCCVVSICVVWFSRFVELHSVLFRLCLVLFCCVTGMAWYYVVRFGFVWFGRVVSGSVWLDFIMVCLVILVW